MPRRASNWILQDHDGTWELVHGGRSMYDGMGSRQEAMIRLKNHHKPGEPVFLEEKDGYRTNITQQLRKGGIIR